MFPNLNQQIQVIYYKIFFIACLPIVWYKIVVVQSYKSYLYDNECCILVCFYFQ